MLVLRCCSILFGAPPVVHLTPCGGYVASHTLQNTRRGGGRSTAVTGSRRFAPCFPAVRQPSSCTYENWKLYGFYSYPKGFCREEDVSLFSRVASDRMRGNGLRLYQEGLGLVRKNFFTESVVRHWNGPPREVVELPSLEIFKRGVDVVLRDMI